MLIRKATKEDYNFICATWLKSYKNSSQFAARIKNEIYYDFHQKVVKRILERGKVLIACEGVGGPILGYLVYEPDVIHFGYVKKAFRHFGIFKELQTTASLDLPGPSRMFTHWTDSVDRMIKQEPDLLSFYTYIPYLI